MGFKIHELSEMRYFRDPIHCRPCSVQLRQYFSIISGISVKKKGFKDRSNFCQ